MFRGTSPSDSDSFPFDIDIIFSMEKNSVRFTFFGSTNFDQEKIVPEEKMFHFI